MSDIPRRSPRLSQHYSTSTFTPLPTFSTSTSTSSTSQSSPTTDPLRIAAQQDYLRLQLQTQFLVPPSQSSAPLPSPSAADCSPFPGFSSHQASFEMPEQSQPTNTTSHPSQTTQGVGQGLQTSISQHNASLSPNQRPSMTQSLQSQGQGPPPGILAEAAKRAQMAVLMRDLGDVTL